MGVGFSMRAFVFCPKPLPIRLVSLPVWKVQAVIPNR
jgi:hypothetical protein